MFMLLLMVAAVIIDQAWLDDRSPPYQLDLPGETYTLATDVTTPGAAFNIKALDIVFDLNGHTITYDTIGGGVPDHSFEVGSEWDMSAAPALQRVPVTDQPRHGGFYIRGTHSTTPQTIVSGWTELPPGKAHVSLLKATRSWYTRVWLQVEVEHETQGVVAGFHDLLMSVMTFDATGGKYRIRLTVVPEALAVWQPNTEYRIGDVVRAAAWTDRRFDVRTVNGSDRGPAGDIEPEWSTELGGLTEDGVITWLTREVGVTSQSGKWEASKLYTLSSSVTPTVPNGCRYTPCKITVLDAKSGTEEPPWQTGNQPTADNTLSWGITRDHDVEFDMVNVRAHGVTGVKFQWWGAIDKKFTIRNGTIRQGKGASYVGHALYVGGSTDARIENLTLETTGLEAAGLQAKWGSNYTVSDCTVRTASAHKFNRHQLAAPLALHNISGAVIANNVVESGEGWGCILVTNRLGEDPIVVEGNTCSTRSVITNHYAVMAYGWGNTVRDNVIDCDPGQGLRLSKTGNVAEGNTITIRSVAPNWDVGRLSVDGIRVNDYNTANVSQQGANNIVRENTVTLYGRNSPRFTRAAQNVNGICNVSRGPGNVYERNTINAIRVDDEVIVSGIQPGNYGTHPVIWRDNVITSDQFHVFFGQYASKCANTLFIGNMFAQGDNPSDDYSILHAMRRFHVLDSKFEQNTIVGPGDFREIYGGITWSHPSNYTVGAASQITINLTGSDYTLSKLQIRDKDGELIHEGGNTATLGGGYSVEFRPREPPYWYYSGEADSGAPYAVSGAIEKVSADEQSVLP